MSNRFEIVMPGLGASSNRGAIGLCNISLIYTGSKAILVDTGSNNNREELWKEFDKMSVDIIQNI